MLEDPVQLWLGGTYSKASSPLMAETNPLLEGLQFLQLPCIDIYSDCLEIVNNNALGIIVSRYLFLF